VEDTNTPKPALMFIHGAWLSARSWETFIDYFEPRGFEVSAPEWPRKEGDVEELRLSRNWRLAGYRVGELYDASRSAKSVCVRSCGSASKPVMKHS